MSYTLNNEDIIWGALIFRDPSAAFIAIDWDDIMTRKTYRIELKIDFNDDARHEPLADIAKQYARDLLGSAMLLQDGRKPIVALITDDSFTGSDEIELLDEGSIHQPTL